LIKLAGCEPVNSPTKNIPFGWHIYCVWAFLSANHRRLSIEHNLWQVGSAARLAGGALDVGWEKV